MATARTWRWATAGIAMGLVVAACETNKMASIPLEPQLPGTLESTPSASSGASPGASSGGSTGGFGNSGDMRFNSWRSDFAAKAAATGRNPATVSAVLDGLMPVEETVQAQSFDNQAEFVKPIWDYAKSAVSPSRITNGQAKLAENAAIFDTVVAAYAPPREILAAVWGMESAYGAVIGNEDAPRVLASQAAVGRRKDFNEGELIAIMRLIEDGSATREQFRKASWAGALGQTQFMPSSLIAYGRDYDGDGHKDIWSNSGDALASAANYLTAYGWKKGQPWAVEAMIPAGFDYSYGDGRRLTVAAWKAIGITPAMPAQFTDTDVLSAELFLPAGSYGPAFLLFENFGIIKRYNNADSYALAIGLLADRLAGRPDLSRPWPSDIQMLTQQQAKDLQTGLNALGFSAGVVDGIIGRGTRGALQKFQKSKGITADGFPTVATLAVVTQAANGG